MALPGRPISKSERADRDCGHLMLYGWKMLIRRDYGGKDIENALHQVLRTYGIKRAFVVGTPVNYEWMASQMAEASRIRMERVGSGVSDRLRHTKNEIIGRINALYQFQGKELTAESFFATWDKQFSFKLPELSSEIDALKKHVVAWQTCPEDQRGDKLDQIYDFLAHVIESFELFAVDVIRDRLSEIHDSVVPLLRQYDTYRDKINELQNA